ncbi:MAG: B12-binding domain-containing radical SAM protein, partial [Anaerolineae bacterium]
GVAGPRRVCTGCRAARDLVDMDAYRRLWRQSHGLFSTNMASTRGCPFHCNWCAKPIWGQRYAMRSPEDVAAEMAEVRRRYMADHIWFADDIFGLRPQWTVDFGRAVAARQCSVPFQIQTRVDLVTEEAAAGLAQAGCVEAWLGVESGSQSILDAMDKGTRVEVVPGAVERLRSRGIRVGFFLQLGYPGETWADIAATANLVRAVVPDAIGVSVSYPLPGTRFHAAVAAQMDGRRRWHSSADLAMMFRGTYTTDMYRALHRWFHGDVDARLALARARSTGRGVAEAMARVAASEAQWQALAGTEGQYRQADATPVAAAKPRPRPDLSGDAN